MAGALLLTTGFGCSAKSPYPLAPEEALATPPARVTLAPGDVVEVKFFYTPQLNELQTVRPDGRLALQLVGDVEAHGRSPAELRGELLQLYAPHLKDPEIVVVARELQRQRVIVGGQVLAPGVVEMPGQLDLLDAIMLAGGFNLQEAEVKNVVVVRHQDNKRYGYAINLKPALEGEETEPFALHPMDIVYVPRTTIAEVGQWVDQHINALIPRNFTYLKFTDTATIGVSGGR
ncbi:MAG: polysaccharide biosynthesis/export family protein [Planctomycetota bacterium]